MHINDIWRLYDMYDWICHTLMDTLPYQSASWSTFYWKYKQNVYFIGNFENIKWCVYIHLDILQSADVFRMSEFNKKNNTYDE